MNFFSISIELLFKQDVISICCLLCLLCIFFFQKMDKEVIETLSISDKDYHLITRYGAIKLCSILTTIGHLGCNIKLHSPDCAPRHASIVIRPDGTVKIFNRADCEEHYIYVNDVKLLPGQFVYLNVDDIISFSGVESFKFVHDVPTIILNDFIQLTPD